MYFLYIIGMLLLSAGCLGALVHLIRKLAKKDTQRIRRFARLTLGAGGLCFLIAMLCSSLSSMLLLAPLALAAAVVFFLVGASKKRRGQEHRRCTLGGFVALGLAACLVIGGSIAVTGSFPGKNATSEDYEIHIQTDYDFVVEDGTEPLVVETSWGCGADASSIVNYRLVYDDCDLHYLLENCDATAEDCLAALESNQAISEPYQTYFADFIRRIAKFYPEANLSILCENLKTLQVIELGRMDYLSKSLSLDSYGCYMRTENIIYIPEGTTYVEGEWGFQVLIHEFCHAARTRWVEYEDGKDKLQFCSGKDNMLLEESMNSAFSCGLLNYYERDIAYQVPSNYLRIMLECMDNYQLDDYLNHSELYFLSKLDEATGYTNYAQVIWRLITLQRSDWEDDRTDIPAEEYEPIYAYLCDLYYDRYITPDMTAAECEAVAADLVDKAFYDAPEGYKIEPDYFYTYLDEYLARNAAQQPLAG